MKDTEAIFIATEYMQIWNAGQEELLELLADENIEIDYTHFETKYSGIAGYKEMLIQTHEYFPDMKIEITDFIPSKNRVTVFWRYSGTHKKGNLFGVSSSGKCVSVRGMSVLEIKNSKISKETGIVDNLSLLRQLGAIEDR